MTNGMSARCVGQAESERWDDDPSRFVRHHDVSLHSVCTLNYYRCTAVQTGREPVVVVILPMFYGALRVAGLYNHGTAVVTLTKRLPCAHHKHPT